MHYNNSFIAQMQLLGNLFKITYTGDKIINTLVTVVQSILK